ncbi:RNA binding protein, putative [Trichomonas vaginalis G3]|uniref:RNA binding protein, putative n=1 Tax=Trichomonas vaginalis (strain ATCC PRA-98 / G3) TaxID=412133 RepID=A2DP24_TRIV3|nr:hypothetical protein TVAGG3_0989310 [Trichomonas vaginalis G3]EAY17873.1 RNA binding protein, putative [Trichomonas vaginalis G3]KAI5489909.1 hypothetical protein TVAGG3_0989310 [Trichomonas vaginalis G3]|eukprot:XP_001330008.1 RNA binding protein [Trichomonas vaginalis G3]
MTLVFLSLLLTDARSFRREALEQEIEINGMIVTETQTFSYSLGETTRNGSTVPTLTLVVIDTTMNVSVDADKQESTTPSSSQKLVLRPYVIPGGAFAVLLIVGYIYSNCCVQTYLIPNFSKNNDFKFSDEGVVHVGGKGHRSRAQTAMPNSRTNSRRNSTHSHHGPRSRAGTVAGGGLRSRRNSVDSHSGPRTCTRSTRRRNTRNSISYLITSDDEDLEQQQQHEQEPPTSRKGRTHRSNSTFENPTSRAPTRQRRNTAQPSDAPRSRQKSSSSDSDSSDSAPAPPPSSPKPKPTTRSADNSESSSSSSSSSSPAPQQRSRSNSSQRSRRNTSSRRPSASRERSRTTRGDAPSSRRNSVSSRRVSTLSRKKPVSTSSSSSSSEDTDVGSF